MNKKSSHNPLSRLQEVLTPYLLAPQTTIVYERSLKAITEIPESRFCHLYTDCRKGEF